MKIFFRLRSLGNSYFFIIVINIIYYRKFMLSLYISHKCFMYSTIYNFSYKRNLKVHGTEEVISSLETLILLLTFTEQKYPYQLKLALKCAVRLCEVKMEYCETFVELLGSRFGNIDGKCFVKVKVRYSGVPIKILHCQRFLKCNHALCHFILYLFF